MPQIESNGLFLEYEVFGAEAAPPVLLIMGLAAQMIFWPDDYCEQIAERGYRVIRFDNRDVGKSSWLNHLPVPNQYAAMISVARGIRPTAPYTLFDMADDTLGLLDGLGVEQAHMVGASMGGMIAQLMAIRNPERCLSLTSIMSTTSHRSVPVAGPKFLAKMALKWPEINREAIVQNQLKVSRLLGASQRPEDRAWQRAVIERAIDRGYNPAARPRQNVAIMASGNRVKGLQKLSLPSLVIHGADDPLIPPYGGIHTAECIPGARLEIIEGMAHDMPMHLVPMLAKMTADHLDSVC